MSESQTKQTKAVSLLKKMAENLPIASIQVNSTFYQMRMCGAQKRVLISWNSEKQRTEQSEQGFRPGISYSMR